MYGFVCRYLKGSRFFLNNVVVVVLIGLGIVGVLDGSVVVFVVEDENLEVGVGEVIVDGVVKLVFFIFRVCIVG